MKWEASFKKKGSGILWWQTCEAETMSEAADKMREQVKPLNYKLYGGPFKVGNIKSTVEPDEPLTFNDWGNHINSLLTR